VIVLAMPRSGGTKFCLDKSEETGLPFFGELHSTHIQEYPDVFFVSITQIKKETHEAPVQPEWTTEQFMKGWADHKNRIVLANAETSTQLLPFADYYLVRRNWKNVFYSSYDYILRSQFAEFIDFKQFVMNSSKVLANSYASILDYCYFNDKEITWYEDLYDVNTEYNLLKTNKDFNIFDETIQSVANGFGISQKIDRLS